MFLQKFKQLNFLIINRFRPVNNKTNRLYFQKRLLAAHAHRTNYTMDKVFLRNDPESHELHISFRYANEDLKIDRDFNFCRKIDEKIEAALNRIRGNIEKELHKKTKKSKKKSPAQVAEPIKEVVPNKEVNLKFFQNIVLFVKFFFRLL